MSNNTFIDYIHNSYELCGIEYNKNDENDIYLNEKTNKYINLLQNNEKINEQ